VLFQANGSPAKSNTRETWMPYDQAAECFERGGYEGVGYVLSEADPFVGIDFDGCRDPETGITAAWAQTWLDRFATYAEISPSRTGWKLFVRAEHPLDRGKLAKPPNAPTVSNEKSPGVEVYKSLRWFAITGEGGGTIRDAGDVLTEFYDCYWPPRAKIATPPKATNGVNSQIMQRARGYISKMGPSIQNNGGDNHAFDVGVALVCGFDLNRDDAWRLMLEWNATCQPPWGDGELHVLKRKLDEAGKSGLSRGYLLQADGNRYEQAERRAIQNERFELTDMGNGERFADQHRGKVRYCHPWRTWLCWDGCRWAIDNAGRPMQLAKQTARSIHREAAYTRDQNEQQAISKHSMASQRRERLAAMLALAQSEDGIPILPDELDRDPWLLNVQNGTLDLRTGKLRRHNQADLITKVAPVVFDATADCPNWLAFLRRVTDDNGELIGYLERLVGYCLTGRTSDHVLPFFYGVGANGKSTFVNTVLALLGDDYGMKSPPEMLMLRRGEQHPTERADLMGKRLAACVETEDGRRLAESLVKELTGGDRVRARRMRQDFFEFSPTHKVWIIGNHKPTVTGTDHGIWRRIKLIPFTVTIPEAERDEQLPDKLLRELSGILNWALLGCREWQDGGLGEPDVVRQATGGYRADEDVLGEFIDECCELGNQCRESFADLYASYGEWCETNRERPLTKRKFGSRLAERGLPDERGTGGRKMRCGIAIRANSE